MGVISGNINPSNASTLAPWFDLVVPNFVEPNNSKTVTIYGGNFDYYTSVKINGLDLSNITYISDREIQVDITDTAGGIMVNYGSLFFDFGWFRARNLKAFFFLFVFNPRWRLSFSFR